MSRKQNGYKTLQIADITGGINQLNSPNNIENKQGVDILNWNFKGNDLVTETGFNHTAGESWTFKVDNGDFYELKKDNNLYFNGTLLSTNYWARIDLNNLFNGNQVAGIQLRITINGTIYTVYTGATLTETYDNIVAIIPNSLTVVRSNYFIYIISNSSITISITADNYYIYIPQLYKTNELTGGVIIGGPSSTNFAVTGNFINQESLANSFNENLGIYLTSGGYNYTNTPVYLDEDYNITTAGNETYVGVMTNNSTYSVIPVSSLLVIEDPRFFIDSSEFKEPYNVDRYITVGPVTNVKVSGQTLEGLRNQVANQINGVGEIINYNGKPAIYWRSGNSIPAISAQSGTHGQYNYTAFDFIIPKNSINYTLTTNDTLTVQSSSSTFSNTTVEEVSEVERLIAATVTSLNSFYLNKIAINPALGSKIIYSTQNSAINGNTLFNITVGNNGNLLIIDGLNGGGWYYDKGLSILVDFTTFNFQGYESIKIDSTLDIVCKPTSGTIYNGKIVLGGFLDTRYGKITGDLVIYSATSSPNYSLELLDFLNYDSGRQLISGGDKGIVVGFTVGENGLYCFKNNSIWYSNSEKDNPNSFSFNLIFNKLTSTGANWGRVITDVQQDTFYFDGEAVRRLSYEQYLTTLRDTNLSTELGDLFKKLTELQGNVEFYPKENQKLAVSYFSYPNYYLSLATKSATEDISTSTNLVKQYFPDITFIYNVENKSWTKTDSLWDISYGTGDWVLASYGTKGEFGSYGYFKNNRDIANSNKGYYLSKEYNLDGDDFTYKKVSGLYINGYIDGPIDSYLSIRALPRYISDDYTTEEADNDNRSDVPVGKVDLYRRDIFGSGSGRKYFNEKIELYDLANNFQFKLEHSGGVKICITNIDIEYKPTRIEGVYY